MVRMGGTVNLEFRKDAGPRANSELLEGSNELPRSTGRLLRSARLRWIGLAHLRWRLRSKSPSTSTTAPPLGTRA